MRIVVIDSLALDGVLQAPGRADEEQLRRVMTLEEMANTAVFVASDKASGMTGTTVNLTMGSLDD